MSDRPAGHRCTSRSHPRRRLVPDPTRAPIGGITVSLANPVSAAEVTKTVSASDGTYSLVAEPGEYVVAFTGEDIASIYYPGIPIDTGSPFLRRRWWSGTGLRRRG